MAIEVTSARIFTVFVETDDDGPFVDPELANA